MSTLAVNSIVPANAGSEDYFLARAWVNFNGTTNVINGSGNVSSITDNGVGDYSVNFLNSMPSVYYSAPRVPDYDGATGTGLVVTSEVLSATSSSIRVTSSAPNGTLYDCVRFDMTVTA